MGRHKRGAATVVGAFIMLIGSSTPAVAAGPENVGNYDIARAVYRQEVAGSTTCEVNYLWVNLVDGWWHTAGGGAPEPFSVAGVTWWGESGCETPAVTWGPFEGYVDVDAEHMAINGYRSAWVANVDVPVSWAGYSQMFTLNLTWTGFGDAVLPYVSHNGYDLPPGSRDAAYWGDRFLGMWAGASLSGTVTNWGWPTEMFTINDFSWADLGWELPKS